MFSETALSSSKDRSVFGARAARHRQWFNFLCLIHRLTPRWFSSYLLPFVTMSSVMQYLVLPFDPNVRVDASVKQVLRGVFSAVSPTEFMTSYPLEYVPIGLTVVFLLIVLFGFIAYCFWKDSLPEWYYGFCGVSLTVLFRVLFFPVLTTLLRPLECSWFTGTNQMIPFPDFRCSYSPMVISMVVGSLLSLAFLVGSIFWNMFLTTSFQCSTDGTICVGVSGRYAALVAIGSYVLILLRLLTFDPTTDTSIRIVAPIIASVIGFYLFLFHVRHVPEYFTLSAVVRGGVFLAVSGGYAASAWLELHPPSPSNSNDVSDWLSGSRIYVLLCTWGICFVIGFLTAFSRMCFIWFLVRPTVLTRLCRLEYSRTQQHPHLSAFDLEDPLPSSVPSSLQLPPDDVSETSRDDDHDDDFYSSHRMDSYRATVPLGGCCCCFGLLWKGLLSLLFRSPSDVAVAAHHLWGIRFASSASCCAARMIRRTSKQKQEEESEYDSESTVMSSEQKFENIVTAWYRWAIRELFPASIELRLWFVCHLLRIGGNPILVKNEISELESSDLFANKSYVPLDTLLFFHALKSYSREMDQLPLNLLLSNQKKNIDQRGTRKKVKKENASKKKQSKRELQRVEAKEREVLRTLSRIWGEYLNDKIPTIGMAGLISDLVRQEKDCRAIYRRVLDLDSSNRSVMMRFARFLRYVACDPLMAEVYEKKLGLRTFHDEGESSDDVESTDEAALDLELLPQTDSPSTPVPLSDQTLMVRTRSRFDDARTIGQAMTMKTADSTVHTSHLQGVKADLAYKLSNRRTNSSTCFSCVGIAQFLVVVLVIVGIIASGAMVMTASLRLSREETLFYSIANLKKSHASLELVMRQLQLNGSMVPSTRAGLLDRLEDVCETIQDSITVGYVDTPRLMPYWRDEDLSGNIVTEYNQSLSLIDAFNLIHRQCASDFKSFRSLDPSEIRNLKFSSFVRDSSNAISKATDNVMEGLLLTSASSSSSLIQSVAIVFTFVLVFVLLMFPVLCFSAILIRGTFNYLLRLPKPIIHELFHQFHLRSGEKTIRSFQSGQRASILSLTICHHLLCISAFFFVVLVLAGIFVFTSATSTQATSEVMSSSRTTIQLLTESDYLRSTAMELFYFSRGDTATIMRIRECTKLIEAGYREIRYAAGGVDSDPGLKSVFYDRPCNPKVKNELREELFCYSFADLISMLIDTSHRFLENATQKDYDLMSAIVDSIDSSASNLTSNDSMAIVEGAVGSTFDSRIDLQGNAPGPLESRVIQFFSTITQKFYDDQTLYTILNVFSVVVALVCILAFYFFFLRSYPSVLLEESLRTQKLLLQVPERDLHECGVLHGMNQSSAMNWNKLFPSVSLNHSDFEDLVSRIEQYAVVRFDKKLRVMAANDVALGMFPSLQAIERRHGMTLRDLVGDEASDACNRWRQNRNRKGSTFSLDDLFVEVEGNVEGETIEFPLALHLVVLGSGSFVAFLRSTEQEEKQKELVEHEKKKSDDLLNSMLPAKIADLVKLGERVPFTTLEASVVFIDLVGFTARCSQMPPEIVISLLDRFFKDLDSRCEMFQIEKIKTIGDCYLAACGVPEFVHEHAKKAFKFAIESYGCLYRLNAENDIDFDLRIGINSGRVIAGVVGVSKWCYDIWGDAVNVASRMETTAERGTIQVSRGTYANVYAHWKFVEKEVLVKGKGRMKTYTHRVINPMIDKTPQPSLRPLFVEDVVEDDLDDEHERGDLPESATTSFRQFTPRQGNTPIGGNTPRGGATPRRHRGSLIPRSVDGGEDEGIEAFLSGAQADLDSLRKYTLETDGNEDVDAEISIGVSLLGED